MDIISESQYIFEKQAFKKLLIDARMHEIVYAETFSLIFYNKYPFVFFLLYKKFKCTFSFPEEIHVIQIYK